MKKLAVFFPGIGYTCDRPLLHFSRKLAESEGCEILRLKFKGFPKNSLKFKDFPKNSLAFKGSPKNSPVNRDRITRCAEIAIDQTKKQLSDVDFSAYDEVVFIAKSIGTIAAGRYAEKHLPSARLILYTPLEETFEKLPQNDAVAFIGSKDPWSDFSRVKHLAGTKGIPLYTYEDCNHSLETGDVAKDIDTLKDVMEKTKAFLESAGN